MMDFRSSKSVRVTHNLHDSLLAKLMTGYVGEDKTSEMYRKWKLQFKRYRDSSAEENYSIQDDFNFLEKSGLLRVGQYDVLEDIFNHVDTKALFDIKLASQMIDNISLAQIQNKVLQSVLKLPYTASYAISTMYSSKYLTLRYEVILKVDVLFRQLIQKERMAFHLISRKFRNLREFPQKRNWCPSANTLGPNFNF
ncbi:uncharacterized protein [Magallana gigas]|uniref:uncharacterized protein isoform X2 n=1 Tax=Magallana gigas TaxID=29159 RepID=UPI00148ADE3F|nr:uncharacterized protein LOC117687678 isoform X2 [Crassostrea gigas]